MALHWLDLVYTFYPVLLLSFYIYELSTSRAPSKETPILAESSFIFSYRSVLNFMYGVKGANIVSRNYEKFKGKAFQFMRGDGNVIVLPIEMVDEFTSLPSTIANPSEGLERDLLAPYTGFSVLSESRLHHAVVQRKLTPRLKGLTPLIEDEVTKIFDDVFPACDEWTEIMPQKLLAQASARLTGRALVGPEMCRNASWIDTSINYTENVFKTASILRFFPSYIHPLISPFLWSYWQCWNYISLARTLASAKAHDFLQRDDDGVSTAGATEDNHGFLWFAESAKGTDRNPQLLAHLQLVLAFAGVHTVLNRMVNVLYDLIANPSYISELRNEISSIHQAGWDASAYDKLLKMDSVIRESQRMNPASSLNVRRVFKKPHTFANGVHIPQGTYACLPVYAIENDPAYVEDPDTFSGLRSYHQRQKNGEEQQHQFTSIDKTNFGFGYGKSACPGRFFASLMIKAVFVKLLTEYEIAFLPGKGRPKCLKLHEFIFPWPWERVLIKKRQKSSCPF